MATSYEGKQRNGALRDLSRFEVSLANDNGSYVYRIRPRGYATVLAEIRARPGVSNEDLLDIGNAVRTLAKVGAK